MQFAQRHNNNLSASVSHAHASQIITLTPARLLKNLIRKMPSHQVVWKSAPAMGRAVEKTQGARVVAGLTSARATQDTTEILPSRAQQLALAAVLESGQARARPIVNAVTRADIAQTRWQRLAIRAENVKRGVTLESTQPLAQAVKAENTSLTHR